MYRKLILGSCILSICLSNLYGDDQTNQNNSAKEAEKENILGIAESGLATAETILEKATKKPQSLENLKILDQVSQSSKILAEAAIDGVPNSPEKQIDVSTAAAIVALAEQELDAKEHLPASSEAETLAAAALEQQKESLDQLPTEPTSSTAQ